MKIFIIFIIIKLIILQASAQSELIQSGDLVSIRIVMGEPLRIFVVGKEEAKLNLSDLQLTIRRLKPYPGQVYSLVRKNDYFIVSDSEDFKKATDVEITTKIKNKSETLQFRLDRKP